MSYKADDDVLPSPSASHQEYFSSAEKERKALEKKIEAQAKEQGKGEIVRLGTEVDLHNLEAQLAGKQDEEKKRKERSDEESKKHETFGTKTIKQEQEAKVMQADTKLTDEKLIDIERAKREADDESQEEMTAGPG